LARVRSLLAISRTRRPAARRSRVRVRVAPPAACTRRTVRAIFPTALASSARGFLGHGVLTVSKIHDLKKLRAS
jgi:hypothetical protein